MTNTLTLAVDNPTLAPLAERTLLVSLSVRQWSARSLDKRATDSVISAAHAKSTAGRFNKCLINPKALSDIQSVVSAARQEHADYTLPWCNDGTRILPADGFMIYSQKMQQHREAFESAVRDFLADYPYLVAEAREHLGDLFRAEDYPTTIQIADRFGWSVDVLPMPDARDFRVNLSGDLIGRLRANMESAMRETMHTAMADVWQRMHTVVSRMAERLKAYKPAENPGDKVQGIFRDSLVENVRELVTILPLLNVTGDAMLAATIERMEEELCQQDASTLRESDFWRHEVAESAEAIMNDMSAFMGE